MSEQRVKLQHWPFNKGEQAQLIWISSPFWHDKKIMIHAYFRAKGKTEKILADWGTLPALAIQHYYVNGDITKSIPPQGINEVNITIYPNNVSVYERDWQVQGTNDKDISRSFIVKQGNQSYVLPLIEVVRSILAPNRFLLYLLFQMDSFAQYFLETYSPDKIHLDFSSNYHVKYTKPIPLQHLVWMLTNRDVRTVFENVAYTFRQKNALQFDWLFSQPITISAVVKPNSNGGTVLRITKVNNKHIPYKEITYSHPEIAQSTKSGEPKKYTLQTKKGSNGQQDELILDEKSEGTTDNFDVVEMENQVHVYTMIPKITKVPRKTNKIRDFEDANTKKRLINSSNYRSTADVGGNNVIRGLEHQPLMDVQIDGELGEFLKVMQVLQSFREVQSINIIQGSLKKFSDKRFVYLSDDVKERRYVIAEVKLFSGKAFDVIEVEREDKAISTFIYFTNRPENKLYELNMILKGLIDNNGVWDKAQLSYKRINYLTLRHGKKEYRHRATVILNKVI